MPSKKAAAAQGNVFARLKVQLEDGREATLFDLTWREVTPLAAAFYRAARTSELSGRKDRDGNPAHISDSTANRELTTLQSMFTHHRDVSKKLPYNPLDGFERTDESEKARQTALTPEQMDAFLSHAHPLYQDIVRVAYRAAGMRKGEVQRLLKSEVDWEARLIRLPAGRNKNRKPRTIPYPDDVDRILRHHAAISRSQYVFVNPRDPKRMAPVTDSSMWFWLDQARRRSGMKGFDDEPIVTHTARHSGVTALMEMGTPERLIRAAAGMSPKTYERYAQVKKDQLEALRSFQNRASTPPTPITTELEDERRPPASTGARGPLSVIRRDS